MRELFSWVYRVLRSKLLGVLVILAMAFLAFMGTLIMQMPSSAVTDAAAKAEWIESVRPRYGGWTAVLDFLGFFNIWTSPLFLGVTVLLALSIIACTVHRLPQLTERAVRPRTHVSVRFFDRAQYRAQMALPMTTAAAREHVEGVLRKKGYRLLPDEKSPETGLYADRFRFGPFGTAIAHASFVIILAAFAISAFTGFERSIEVGVGERVEVGHNTGLSLTAASFNDSYDEQGRPTDYVSHLIVHRGDQVVGEADVRVNTPLVVDGVAFHQASFGIAASIKVSKNGADLFTGSVPLKWQSKDGRYAIGKLLVPGTSTEVLVVTPASGSVGGTIAAGTAVFEVYDAASGSKLDAVPASQGETVSAAGLDLRFEREQRYTGIMVRQDPGVWWMWIGSALLIIGMTMTFALRHRRLWVRIDEEDGDALVRIASAEKLDTTFERQFRQIVNVIDQTAPDALQGGKQNA